MKIDKQKQGKKARSSGARFELKVRVDLENDGWICDKWSNNVDLKSGKLVKAKRKYNPFKKVMVIGTGFPDFIAFRNRILSNYEIEMPKVLYEIIGVECKSNGYLDKEEKEKCRWLLDNNVFSKILIAKKGKIRGKIEYKEFK